MSKQYAGRKIRANVVSPGMVYFEGGIWHQIEQHNTDFYKTSLASNPTGRMASPQDVANRVVSLARPCFLYTTGINMIIDGALTGRVSH